jgi:hypothetical protein
MRMKMVQKHQLVLKFLVNFVVLFPAGPSDNIELQRQSSQSGVQLKKQLSRKSSESEIQIKRQFSRQLSRASLHRQQSIQVYRLHR